MLLFIAQDYDTFFGGGMITHRNYRICQKALGEDKVFKYLLPKKKQGGLRTLKAFLAGYLMELSPFHEIQIINILRQRPDIHYVFIDGSLIGRLSLTIKKEFPNIHVMVFFHNIEYSFFRDFLRSTKKYWHAIGLWAILKNESRAIEYASSIITLNNRDSDELLERYKRSADLILPTSLDDSFDFKRIENREPSQPVSLLFVGSRFFPNEQGISWFIAEVMPHLNNAHLTIVGRGFEELAKQWNSATVEVIGSCEDLSVYYYKADIVVAPIFTGYGMKTKTAEALMYGKTILASSEALEGYALDVDLIGGKFNEAYQYIDYINNFKPEDNRRFNHHSRYYFTGLYSTDAVLSHFKYFLK